MSAFLHGCGKTLRSGRWRLAAAVVIGLGLSGCKSWDVPDDGLRNGGLSDTVRQARSANADPEKKKEADDPWMSDRANQISHDLQ
jgi:hypothetical protein